MTIIINILKTFFNSEDNTTRSTKTRWDGRCAGSWMYRWGWYCKQNSVNVPCFCFFLLFIFSVLWLACPVLSKFPFTISWYVSWQKLTSHVTERVGRRWWCAGQWNVNVSFLWKHISNRKWQYLIYWRKAKGTRKWAKRAATTDVWGRKEGRKKKKKIKTQYRRYSFPA